MNCANCGATVSPGLRDCPACGNQICDNDFVYASITLTWEEARKGGLFPVELRNLVDPIRVRIKPGTRSGDKVQVTGAAFKMPDESVMLAPVEVTIHVEGRPLWQPMLAVLACLLLTAAAVISVRNILQTGDSPQQIHTPLPTKPTTVSTQSTTVPTQPTTAPTTTTAPDTQMETTAQPDETETTAPETTVPPTTAPPTTEPPTTEPPTQNEPSEKSIIPHLEMRMMLQQLSEDQLTNLEALYRAVMNFEKDVVLPCKVGVNDLVLLTYIMEYECPELMQFGGGTCQDVENGIVKRYVFNYRVDRAKYTEMYNACMEVINRLVDETQGMTDWDKELYAFDYITTHCRYDINAENAHNAYGTLVQELSKCHGISFAMKWILEEMGIPCMAVNGENPSGTMGHAWNYVLLDGEYYTLDVTADVRDPGSPYPVFYNAFNVTTDIVEGDMVPYDHYRTFVQTPTVTTMENSYHVRKGSYIYKGQDWRPYVKSAFLAALDSGEDIRIRFEDAGDFLACKNALFSYLDQCWREAGSPPGMMWSFWDHEWYRTICIVMEPV